ncbi:MAG TPA: DUF5666 domain-containing protein [Candidatus Eisenbacteria bacterium]|nr:DUF5666 domain-containing protein [Candidatus Eisenbacteria bacterium]
MKRLVTLAVLGLLLAPAAYAETAWGTVNSASANTLNVNITNPQKNIPASLTITVDENVKVKGAPSAADLKSGDNVKLNLKEDNGTWVAKSVEKVESIPAGQQSANATAGTGTTNPNANANY